MRGALAAQLRRDAGADHQVVHEAMDGHRSSQRQRGQEGGRVAEQCERDEDLGHFEYGCGREVRVCASVARLPELLHEEVWRRLVARWCCRRT